MDTSEQYIKMCDWPEIQDMTKAEEGDWFFCKCRDIPNYPKGFGVNVITSHDADCANGALRGSDTDTFLPRQDQIQEWMNYCFWDVMLENFIEFYDGGYVSEIGFLSMEQFWLAFYMHEKHGKVWNGEEWAKSDGAKGLGKVSKESPSTVTRER